ncbi:MAG: YhbD family protein [Lachnospiraceae bacterium]|nr:DUF4004 family protein [Lachnospiraceae bacterium]MCR5085797.1 YhbD family protein [Lachnospiraceae bacterium]
MLRRSFRASRQDGGDSLDSETKLISKKALLERYGISYGSLYRWKRKGLIPDEWFLRKTTVTGQETYFPEDVICKRVELILSTKEDVLLDELAARISGENRNTGTVTVETNYGSHAFRISDIRRITLTALSGAVTDITDTIKQLIDGGNNS